MVVFKRMLLVFLNAISYLVPKSKKVWLFGSWSGKQYSDNTKYLFEYVATQHPEITPIWLTKSEKILRDVCTRGYRAYHSKSLFGIYYTLRSGVVFEIGGNSDLGEVPLKRMTTIQLWHGMSVKKLEGLGGGPKSVFEKLTMQKKSQIYYMASSMECSAQFEQVFAANQGHVRVTGFPRNDTFVTKPTNAYFTQLREKYPGCKILIYMPTHRGFGKHNKLVTTIDSLREVNNRLAKQNYFLIFKPHYHEMANFLQYKNELSNIVIAHDEVFTDVYSFLHNCDLLISDYSSVMNDFVCADKPIVVFPYDLSEFENDDMGLYDIYLERSLGPICYTWHEVMEKSVASLTGDDWCELRRQNAGFYHLFNDGKNCERVYHQTVEILKCGN